MNLPRGILKVLVPLVFKAVPDLCWRALLLLALVGPALAPAQPAGRKVRPPPNYVQFGTPDQEEGARILRGFRSMGIAGDYYLEFRLRLMPRRGPEAEEVGRLWGTRNAVGPIQRVELGQAGVKGRWLIQNGVTPMVWQSTADDRVTLIATEDLFFPLISGGDLTLFDLQMPYLYWEEFVFEGVSRIRGRPAHTFLLYPPASYLSEDGELVAVRVQLDTQFNALVQSELIGADNRPYKIMTVLDLKKFGEQWMVKTLDLRNERTRNKTRFQVAGAALGQDFSPVIFQPEQLDIPLVPPEGVGGLRDTP